MSDKKLKPHKFTSCKLAYNATEGIEIDENGIVLRMYNMAPEVIEGECEVIEDLKMIEGKDRIFMNFLKLFVMFGLTMGCGILLLLFLYLLKGFK